MLAGLKGGDIALPHAQGFQIGARRGEGLQIGGG
jgi:hypothetical protein